MSMLTTGVDTASLFAARVDWVSGGIRRVVDDVANGMGNNMNVLAVKVDDAGNAIARTGRSGFGTLDNRQVFRDAVEGVDNLSHPKPLITHFPVEGEYRIEIGKDYAGNISRVVEGTIDEAPAEVRNVLNVAENVVNEVATQRY